MKETPQTSFRTTNSEPLPGGRECTQDELEALLAYWQKTLHLLHWEVKVRISRFRDLDDGTHDEYGGRCHYEVKRLSAMIEIRDPLDFKNEWFPQDMEETLVHELLHLWFAPYMAEEGDEGEREQEQTISTLAAVLVGLRRENGKK